MDAAYPGVMTRDDGAAEVKVDERPRSWPPLEFGAWIALGAGVGAALGVILDDLALGLALGAGMGVAIGAGLESLRSGGPAAAAP